MVRELFSNMITQERPYRPIPHATTPAVVSNSVQFSVITQP